MVQLRDQVPAQHAHNLLLIRDESAHGRAGRKATSRTHIPLTAAGEGIDALEGWCEQQELEEFVKIWLRKTVRRLEEERSKEARPAKATAANEG